MVVIFCKRSGIGQYPSRREWQRATHLLRECKQWLVDGWENGSLTSSVTTGDINDPLYSALQNQAIRNAKSHYDDEPIEYTGEQPHPPPRRVRTSAR
jgi:hypothetical protein